MKQDNATLKISTFKFNQENQDGNFGRPEEEDGFTIFLGATPAAFRTDLGYPKDDNEDFDINFSKPITFAESREVAPDFIRNAKIGYSDQEQTWKINNNGSFEKQFKGQYYQQTRYDAELPNQWLESDLSGNKFKSSSSKGSFYSAAFRLQRTLSSNLDIDPDEIEIAAIESIELPEFNGVTGRRSASIVLTDELPNG